MGLYDGMTVIGEAPKRVDLYAGMTVIGQAPSAPPPQARAPTGAIEHIQAGFQSSGAGLLWRRQLPELIMNPEHSSWWERALSGIATVAGDLPAMIPGAMVGAPAGAAAGTAVAGPPGTLVGGWLGAGAGMSGAAALVRESLMAAYQSGDLSTKDEFWAVVKHIAQQTGKEAALGGVTWAAGGAAGRAVGKALAPSLGTTIEVPTQVGRSATGGFARAQGATDIATQIAGMVTIPAALQGRMPDMQEFVDAGIVIGGLKVAHKASSSLMETYKRTGKTPLEVVLDSNADPSIAKDLTEGVPRETRANTLLELRDELSTVNKTLLDGAAPEEIAGLKEQAAKLERQIGVFEKFDESGQRVYDEALKQITDLESSRVTAGLPRIYDRPPTAVAALVRAEVEAFAHEFRRSPEDIYRERYPTFLQGGAPEAGALFQGEPVFYSEVARQIDASKQGAAPAEQWKSMLKNMKGVKPDELDAIGLPEWLDLQPGKVTKEQLKAFVEQNGVKVEETVLGKESPAEGSLDFTEGGLTKFSQYQLPGGTNYKELLLTLPERGKVIETKVNVPRGWGDTEGGNVGVERTGGERDFRSSHFDQPNILAHIRFNERTDADGKRVLFVEEIQSDWAQKGKKEGFRLSSEQTTPMDAEYRALVHKNADARAAGGEPLAADVARARELEAALERADKSKIPSAPFVSKTEAWVSLAMKRMIRYAADNGFDRVAWTTGEQQAARYDLSKQIDSLHYDPYNKQLSARKGNQQVIKEQGVSPEKIADYVGKEAAKKLLETELNGAGNHELKGVDLQVGGEGMKAFYDQIVPNVANDLLKKFGGGRVGPAMKAIAMRGTAPQPGFDLTPELKAKAQAGLPLFQANRASYDVNARVIRTFETANESSVLHELGHHFLENLKYYASREDAPARVKQRWEIARREFAIGEEITTASHEMMARSFERYLAEGTAPSPHLRTMFEQFKQWMLKVYTDLKNIGEVKINPEVARLFDMMLAGDEQAATARAMNIPRAYVPAAKANEAAKLVPGFKDEQLSMFPLAEELQIGPGSGRTNDSRVNAQYINGPMELKLAIEQISRIDQENIQQARGGRVETWEATNEKVDRIARDALGGDVDALGLFRGDPNAPPANVQLRGAFHVMKAIAKHSLALRDQILKKGADATAQEQSDYMQSIIRMRMAHAEFLGQRAAVARALNQIRDMAQESGAVDAMVKAMDRNFGGKTALDIAKLQEDVPSLKGQLIFAKAVTDATKWEMVVEGWKAGLLSGPVTPVTNLFGTGAFQLLRPVVDIVAGGVGMLRGAKVGTGADDRAAVIEGVARMAGWLLGTSDGLKLGYHVLKQDQASMKVEQYRQAIPGRLGQIVRTPLNLMSAGDAVTTTMYLRGELHTLAMRQAFAEGLNPLTREFAERTRALVDKPPEAMRLAAEKEATRMAFNSDLGEKGVALQRFVKVAHLEMIVPFIRTPLNIMKEVMRMSPFAPIIGEWRAALKEGGVARDRAVAELLLGSGIMAIAIGLFMDGSLSGSGSPDPGKNRAKEGVWQPGSVRVGDTWYEIQRIQPLGTLLILAADMANVWEHMTPEESDKVPKLVATAFAQAVTNQTFLQGITNLVQAISEPDRRAAKAAQGFAASWVPNIIGQPTTMADPVVREVNGMLQAIQARIPGLREDLPAKKDWLGEDVKTKERMGLVSPIRTLQVSEDKVRLEAARLDLSVAVTPKKIHLGKIAGKIGDIDLTPEERTAFAKAGGQMAHKILSQIVQAPRWGKTPEIIQRRIFGDVLRSAHQYAAAVALPIDKRQAYMESIAQKMAIELEPRE